MEHQLYPLKFEPIFKETLWGGSKLKSVLNKNIPSEKTGESWELSAVEGNMSVVKEGFLQGNTLEEIIEVYMSDLVGEKVYEKFGVEFPLLIKFIDAADDLSIQVHPNDELAKKRHHAYGKTEMWYILEADPGAKLITGFNRKLDKETYLDYFRNGRLRELLNYEPVKAGDVFLIPAGRIHAIGKGILLAEIQQTSDITYRIYDWDRKDAHGKPRELHVEDALDAIDYNYYKEYKTSYVYSKNKTSNIIDNPYFFTNLLFFDEAIEKDYTLIDSFVIYICVEGLFDIQYTGGKTSVSKGETVLLPADLKSVILFPHASSKLLEVYIK